MKINKTIEIGFREFGGFEMFEEFGGFVGFEKFEYGASTSLRVPMQDSVCIPRRRFAGTI